LSASASAIEPSARERRAFVLRKLHSLTGALPIGGFLVAHLWTNARALQGRAAYEAAAGDNHLLPHRAVVELALVAAPLALHALLGVLILLEARPRLRSHTGARYSAYVLQRATGLALLAFLVFHVGELRLASHAADLTAGDRFAQLCTLLSSTSAGVPVRAIVYTIGVAAASYHLANGLRNFCFGWGVTTSRRAGRIVGGITAVLGLALFALGATTVVYFATGVRLTLDAPGADGERASLDCDGAATPPLAPPTTAADEERRPEPGPAASSPPARTP
jgi:succinate dehydrogenase/fumarate reductase cytochrome b subunit (b558 family)